MGTINPHSSVIGTKVMGYSIGCVELPLRQCRSVFIADMGMTQGKKLK